MSKRKTKTNIGRFGVRYGRTVRKRLGQIEIGVRRKHKCPDCGSATVKRVSVGIWNCRKCELTFSGGAYLPSTSLGEIAKRNAKKGT